MIGREQLEAREYERLGPQAAKAAESRGRLRDDEADPFRTAFQRDRDRILHCKAFRRLSHKTQVFISAQGDHYRTRLTHTLEVQQISRTIARALALNEDLTEAIALGHDLGHTPFGHTGERAIQAIIDQMNQAHPAHPRQQFHHNLQSLRVVDVIEKDGRGLNLTAEVRDGIAHHTGPVPAFTLEGQIVALADRIAYVNHDIDDSIRAGLIDESQLPRAAIGLLGDSHSKRITSLIHATIVESDGAGSIAMQPRAAQAMDELRTFMFEHVYLASPAKEEGPKAERMIAALFGYYMEHPEQIPAELRAISGQDDVQAVIDHIASMTDRFAMSRFNELFVPNNWRD